MLMAETNYTHIIEKLPYAPPFLFVDGITLLTAEEAKGFYRFREDNMDCRLTGINLYPVKSLGSVAPRRALATELGLDGDRRWVLADRQGRFLSQRSHPSLARLQVARTPEGLVITPDRGSAVTNGPHGNS